MTQSGATAAAPRSATLDRRAVLELASEFVLATAIFGVLAARFVILTTDANTYTAASIAIGLTAGAFLSAGMVAFTIRSWRRSGGRPAHRLGLRAWQTGLLPADPRERAIILQDLQRRARAMATQSSFPPAVIAGLYVAIAALQIVTAKDPVNTAIWVLLAVAWFVRAVIARRRRRRLPQLESLIKELEQQHTLNQ